MDLMITFQRSLGALPYLHSYRRDVVVSETRDLYHRSAGAPPRSQNIRGPSYTRGMTLHTLSSASHGTRACSRSRKSAKTGPAQKMPAFRARQHPNESDFTRFRRIRHSYWLKTPTNRSAAPPIHSHASGRDGRLFAPLMSTGCRKHLEC